jgi:hypothetical protein
MTGISALADEAPRRYAEQSGPTGLEDSVQVPRNWPANSSQRWGPRLCPCISSRVERWESAVPARSDCWRRDSRFDDDGRLIPEVFLLLQILSSEGDDAGWRRAFWLYTPHALPDGRAPSSVFALDRLKILEVAMAEFNASHFIQFLFELRQRLRRTDP